MGRVYSTVQYSMVRMGNVTRDLERWGVRMGERPARCMMIPHCANELRAVRDAACKTAIEQSGMSDGHDTGQIIGRLACGRGLGMYI